MFQGPTTTSDGCYISTSEGCIKVIINGANLYSPKNIANAVSLDFSFVNVYFFYIYGDIGSGILNVNETKQTKTLKHNAKSLGGPN